MAVKSSERGKKDWLTFSSIQQVTELKTLKTKKASVKMTHDNIGQLFQ